MKKPPSLANWNYQKAIDYVFPIPQYRDGFFADWQYLVILDACRWDIFAEIARERYNRVPLKVDTGCLNTHMWYKRYWNQKDMPIRLISSHAAPFHSAISNYFKSPVWVDPAGRSVKASPDLAPIRADFKESGLSVFDPVFALRTFEIFKIPGERYMIHLLPPHLPYQGEHGRELFKRLGIGINGVAHLGEIVRDYGRKGHWNELRTCYKENVEYALDVLERFTHLFADGKMVISADHGELLGEPSFDKKGLYGHAYHPKDPDLAGLLRTVPWIVWDACNPQL